MSRDTFGVIATNDDATQCKVCAVEKGYWNDPYIMHFASKNRVTKTPEISRGYFARVKGIEILIEHLSKKYGQNLQIVSLGAGFDTLFWRLFDRGITFRKFVEVDYPQVAHKKITVVNKTEKLLEGLTDPASDSSDHNLHSAQYDVISGDLTKCEQLLSSLSACHLSTDLPTVFLAECVLVYIDEELCNKLLSKIADQYQSAYFINYEQVNLDDQFGRVMIENLKHRNCSLLGVNACQSLETQKQRFLTNGWQKSRIETMLAIYRSLPSEEIQRITRLEFLDEVELLNQLLEHYCICWSTNYASEVFDSLTFV